MSLDRVKSLLVRLLNAVIALPDVHPRLLAETNEAFLIRAIPEDLPGSEQLLGGELRLVGDALHHYDECLLELLAEGESGELEYLAQQDIERALWRLVCETWLNRHQLSSQHLTNSARIFIAEHRRVVENWEVLWEIDQLKVDEPFAVANVEFFAFSCESAHDWCHPVDHPSRFREAELEGRAFALAMVRAGAHDKAMERGKQVIDDALNVLRVVLRESLLIPTLQRQQARGVHYFVRKKSHPTERHGGWQRGFRGVELGIGGPLLEGMKSQIGAFAIAFDDSRSANVREPLVRSLTWIGSGMTKPDFDDRIVYLCTALECLLALPNDGRKAEAVALRYMLLGYAVEDDSYVTHPLEIYELYLLRNKIIHGAARRICNKTDVDDLEYVALDVVERYILLIQNRPEVTRISQLHTAIATQEALGRALQFIDKHAPSLEAVKAVGGLARHWLGPSHHQ